MIGMCVSFENRCNSEKMSHSDDHLLLSIFTKLFFFFVSLQLQSFNLYMDLIVLSSKKILTFRLSSYLCLYGFSSFTIIIQTRLIVEIFVSEII